jgi:plastocyanin
MQDPMLRTPTRLAKTAALALAAALLATAACGGSDTSDDPLTTGGMSETVLMENTQFKPGNLQVPVGATITFENRDGAQHDAQANDKSWETKKLGKNDAEAVTFDQAGEWLYKCTIHPSMKARITVVE